MFPFLDSLFCRKIMLYIVTTISTDAFFAKFVFELFGS